MKERRWLIEHYIQLSIFLVGSIFLIIFRNQLINEIKYFVGAMMLFEGVYEATTEFFEHGKTFWKENRTFLALVDILFGFNLLLIPTLDYSIICVIWASWSIVKESYEIYKTVNHIRFLFPKIIGASESAVVMVLSIMLIMEPGEHHAMLHLYYFIAELIFTPLIPIIDEHIYRYKENKRIKSEEVQQ